MKSYYREQWGRQGNLGHPVWVSFSYWNSIFCYKLYLKSLKLTSFSITLPFKTIGVNFLNIGYNRHRNGLRNIVYLSVPWRSPSKFEGCEYQVSPEEKFWKEYNRVLAEHPIFRSGSGQTSKRFQKAIANTKSPISIVTGKSRLLFSSTLSRSKKNLRALFRRNFSVLESK